VDRGRREKRKRGERYVEAIEERSFVAALIWMTAKRGWALRVGQQRRMLGREPDRKKRGRLTQRTAEKGRRSRRERGGISIRGEASGESDWMMGPT